MSVFKSSTPIKKVLHNVTGDFTSDPIFVADTKSIEFSLITALASNFDVFVITSIQELPPDPSLPVGVNNDYQYTLYNDETAPASYNQASPYNPGGAISKLFRSNTDGVRWFFIQIGNYAGGAVIVSNVNISDNE